MMAQSWEGGTRLTLAPEVMTGAPMPGAEGVCLERRFEDWRFEASLILMSFLCSLLDSAFLAEEVFQPGGT